MQYLVSVENSNYFYWQLELLIESFLMQGLQDNLVISIAENDEPKFRGYSKNIVKYGKKIIHSNVGKERGFAPANRFYTIKRFFESGEIDLPFTVIHADMIMKNPIDKYNKEADIVINNQNVFKNDLTLEYIRSSGVKERLVEKDAVKEEDVDNIIETFPYSMPIIFNESLNRDFLSKFFDKLIINLEQLIKTKDSSFPIEKTCWIYTFLESIGFYSATGSFLTCELMHSEDLDVPFIHYKNGIPPVFNKRFFKFEPGTYHNNFEGPYEFLLENNPTENTSFLQQVIKSYIKRNR
jgi:hypothetical protein